MEMASVPTHKQIKARIDTYLAIKRKHNMISNEMEYLDPTQVGSARVSAKTVDRDSQIRVSSVDNDDRQTYQNAVNVDEASGPGERKHFAIESSDDALQYSEHVSEALPVGVEERLHNLEVHLRLYNNTVSKR